MAQKNQEKQKIIKSFSKQENDTGSTTVQVALLSGRITHLTEHMKTHKKDHSSKQGLLKLVSYRRRLLGYLSRNSPKEYESLIERLGLKK